MKQMKTLIAAVLATLPGSLLATHYEPWFTPKNEINGEVGYTYQWYHKINADSQGVSNHSDNQYLHFSLSDTVVNRVNTEAEYTAFHSSSVDNSLTSDSFKLTGRYQWLDAYCGDKINLATGLSVCFPTEAARRNTGVFYHSDVDFTLHMALGNQFPSDNATCLQCVQQDGTLAPLLPTVKGASNYWGMVALGKGTSGDAWLEAQLAGEKQFAQHHFVRLLGDYNQGFGHRDISSSFNPDTFSGYGKVRYRAVDLEARYTYAFSYSQTLSASYLHRVFARNCPAAANALTLAYNFAF